MKDDVSKGLSFSEPLTNRRLNFWPWPFGAENGMIIEKIEQSDAGKEAMRAAQAEELRLLYVGFTRARDLLILVMEKDQPHPWYGFACRANSAPSWTGLINAPDRQRHFVQDS